MEQWKQEISKIDVRLRNGADIAWADEKKIRKAAMDFLSKAQNEMSPQDFSGLMERTKYFFVHIDTSVEKIEEKLNGMKNDALKYTKYQFETNKYRIYLENNEKSNENLFSFIEHQVKEIRAAIEPMERELWEKARSILDFYSAKNGWWISQFFKEDRKSITYNEWETTLEILQDKRNAEEAIRKLKRGLKEWKTVYELKKDKVVGDFMESPEGILMTDIINAWIDEKKIWIAQIKYLLNQARYLKWVGYGGDMIAQKYYGQVASLNEEQYKDFAQAAQQERMGTMESFHRWTFTNLADTFLSLDQVAIMVAWWAAWKWIGWLTGKSATVSRLAVRTGDVVNKSKIAKAFIPGVKMISRTWTGKMGKIWWGALNMGLDVGKAIVVQWWVEKIWWKDAGKIAAAMLMFLPGAKSGFESQMSVNLAKDAKNMWEFTKWTMERYWKEKTEKMIYEWMIEVAKNEWMKGLRLFKGLSITQTEQFKESAKKLAEKFEELAIFESKNAHSQAGSLFVQNSGGADKIMELQTKRRWLKLLPSERVQLFKDSKQWGLMSSENRKAVKKLLLDWKIDEAEQLITSSVKEMPLGNIEKSKAFLGLSSEAQKETRKLVSEGKLLEARTFLKRLQLDSSSDMRKLLFSKDWKLLLKGEKAKGKVIELIEKELWNSLALRQKQWAWLLMDNMINTHLGSLNPAKRIPIEIAFREWRLLDGMILCKKAWLAGIIKRIGTSWWQEAMQLIFAPMFMKRIYENPQDFKSWSDTTIEMFLFYASAGLVEKAIGFIPWSGSVEVVKQVLWLAAVPVGWWLWNVIGEHLLETKFEYDKRFWSIFPERENIFEKEWYGKEKSKYKHRFFLGFTNNAADWLMSPERTWVKVTSKLAGPVEKWFWIPWTPIVFFETAVNLDVNPQVFMAVSEWRNVDVWNKKVSEYCDLIAIPKLQKLFLSYKYNTSPFSTKQTKDEKHKQFSEALEGTFTLKSKGFFEAVKENISHQTEELIEMLDNPEFSIDDESIQHKTNSIVFWIKEVMSINDFFVERRIKMAEAWKRGLYEMIDPKEWWKMLKFLEKTKNAKELSGSGYLGFERFQKLIELCVIDKRTRKYIASIVDRTYKHERLIQSSEEGLLYHQLIDGTVWDDFVAFLNFIVSNERTFQFVENVKNENHAVKWK